MKEIQIKTLLVEHLLKYHDDIIIGSEVAFQFGSRRADIISIINDTAIAYEIKGVSDSVERLEYQMKSYKLYFDYCYVVCEKNNLTTIRKNIRKEVGIMVIQNEEIKQVRKPKRFKKHNKCYLASTLPITELRKYIKSGKYRSKHDLCIALAVELSSEEIRKLSRNNLKLKYQAQTNLLRRDILCKVHSDDIVTISRSSPGTLRFQS